MNVDNGTAKKTELNGKTWLQYSISVWNDIRKSKEELQLKHPAMFPVMLCKRLIEIFSKEEDLIIDPFAGTGSTLIACSTMNRRSLGVELSSSYIDIYRTRLAQMDIFESTSLQNIEMVKDDARELTKYVDGDSVQLTITSPPYWDILKQRRSADGKETRDYGNDRSDLGTIHNYELFLSELSVIFRHLYEVTKTGGYCCIVLMDLRKGNKFYPFHLDVINSVTSIGFELDDIIIWDRRQEYNNLRPLGYPHVFRVNKVHEYVLIFQKLDSNGLSRAT